MLQLIHFGCSFAVGNGIPHFIPGLPEDIASHIHRRGFPNRQKIFKKYNFNHKDPINCGMHLAKKLNVDYERIADNGASNEMIFRKLLETELNDSFVLIGITSSNRREGLTTKQRNTHWHTWKMIGLNQEPKHKDLVFSPWGIEYVPAIAEEMQIRTVMQIIYMQNYLKNNNISYLMFNALSNGFDKPLTDECSNLLKQVDEKHYYNLKGNFDNCQHGWCIKEGLSVSENDEHPNVQGNKQWSLKLLPMVKEIWK